LPGLEKLSAKDPKTIGPYELVARLGSGGMGVVFLGTLGVKRVAVKTVRSSFLDDPGLKGRFQREIENLKAMNYPRIAKFLDSSIDEDIAWHAVEFVNGPNLSELVKSEGPLPEDQWWTLAAQLIETLGYLDSLGIVHRDIKPSNIIMSESGISLIDFGISQDSDSTSITSTGLVSGSPAWLAPEQLEGTTLSSASDWFSAGSVLVFAAKGKSPWGNETSMTIPVLYQKILTAEPDYSGLTQEQRDLVENLLDPDPKSRKLPKALPKFSGATTTSVPSRKTSTPLKSTSKRPSVPASKSKFTFSTKFTQFALVAALVIVGSLGFFQLTTTSPVEVASEQNEKTPTGLASRDFAPSEPCGALDLAAQSMISSMNQASADMRKSNWATVRPSAVEASQKFQASLLGIPEEELPSSFVKENLGYLEDLTARFETMDPASTFGYVTAEPTYATWKNHMGEIFEPGNWCG
jgi:serine/threonine protein kinase